MNRLIILLCVSIVLLLVGGCAIAKKTYTADGKEGFSITCSGSALTWGNCYEKAGEICGTRGYAVLEKSGEGGAVVGGSSQGFYGGSMHIRNMVVQCK